MKSYKDRVIRHLVKNYGKSYEWAEYAVNQLDLGHYSKRYFSEELAELILLMDL